MPPYVRKGVRPPVGEKRGGRPPKGTVPNKVNDRQEMFCREYILDFNANAAAGRAGYETETKRAGYSLTTKPHVLARIAELMEERIERTRVDADSLLVRLAEEANADVADIIDEATGEIKPVHQWPAIWRKGLVSGIDVIQNRGETTTKLRLSDRTKRLELLGRHVNVGAFRDKVEVTGKDGAPMEVIRLDMDPAEASRIYLESLKKPT